MTGASDSDERLRSAEPDALVVEARPDVCWWLLETGAATGVGRGLLALEGGVGEDEEGDEELDDLDSLFLDSDEDDFLSSVFLKFFIVNHVSKLGCVGDSKG